MTAQDNATLVRTLIEVYNAHESDSAWLEKASAFLADDCEVIDVPSGWTAGGPSHYKQLLLFFADAFPSSRVEVTTVVATEQEAVIEFLGRGANTGPLHLPTGDVPATGRSVELRFCDTIQIRKGKVVRVHIYYDVMTMLRQLGLAG